MILDKIRKCKWFSNFDHHDKEDFIKAKLIDELDKRQTKDDFFNRMMSKSDVHLIFEQAKSGSFSKKNDPIWKMWDSIDIPSDKRSVTDKIKSRWNSVDKGELLKYAKKAVHGGIERGNFEGDKNFMSLRYRIYDICEDKLKNMLENDLQELSYPKECIESIFSEVKMKVEDLSNTFSYGFNSEVLIYNVIMELIDNCYLAFDDK